MPTINFISDIHLEFGAYEHTIPDEAEVIIVAGDLSPGIAGVEWLEELNHRSKVPVIYTPGNHCLWYSEYQERIDFLRRQCDRSGVHFLYNDTVHINDVVYIGATMWTNFGALGNPVLAMAAAPGAMNDYKYMWDGPNHITPEFILGEHTKSIAYIKQQLEAERAHQRVVVTHHAPSGRSTTPHNAHKSVPYYASSLEALMLDHNPEVWIHGHIHRSVRYIIGDTLVMSNPRGYAGHLLNEDFDPEILLEF